MPSKDPEQRRKVWRDWYSNHKTEKRAKVKQIRKDLRQWLLELKSSLKCTRCGFAHPAVIDFHHRDPTQKDFILAACRSKSRKKIMEEIAKCDPLCANCHRILHFMEKHPEYMVDKDG